MAHDEDAMATPTEELSDPARRPRGWPVYVAIALLLVVALVWGLLGGVSFFGPRVPTPTPMPAPADLSARITAEPGPGASASFGLFPSA